ncbi:MAG TPA: YihY/virulence factor BrkB family protein, partial [Chthoniobacterales bacterium]
LAGYVGKESAKALQSMVESASKPSHGVIGTIVGFLTLLVGASGVFGQLKDALNTIWEVKAKSGGGVMGFLKERLLNFGMVLVIGFLLLTSLLLTTAIAAMNKFLGDAFGLPSFIWGIISFIISFGLVTVLFAVIFKMLPDAKIRWRNVWIGAAVTSGLFELGKFGLSFYLGSESTASSYGAAASVILLLLWVYYTSCILFLGAEFTQVYAKATGHVIEPSDNAEPVTAEARAQQGLQPAKKAEAAQSLEVTTPEPPRERPTLVESPLIYADAPAPSGSPFTMSNALLCATALGLLAGLVTRSGNKSGDN